jgi:hypothetical protein
VGILILIIFLRESTKTTTATTTTTKKCRSLCIQALSPLKGPEGL